MDQQYVPHFGSGGDQSPQPTNFFVYCWGKNKDGELSIGNQKFVTTPKPVRGIKNTQIIQISSGSQHSALVTKDGKLFVCGSALHQKLGLEEQNQPSYMKFQQVACGDYHTMCLTDSGEVFAWGGTLHKKLGQRAGRPASIQPLQGKYVVYIDCGDFHSAALTENGEIYTWGGGGRDYNRGQLGHGHLNDVEMPEKVKFGQEVNIQKMSCGGYHMMALDLTGQLWSWGQGMYGETGLGEFQDIALPKKVIVNFNQKSVIIDDLYLNQHNDHISQIVQIKLGGHHSVLLNNRGMVYTCGYSQYGQLGLKSKENQNKFQLVIGLMEKQIVQIAAGWNHTVVLSAQHDIFTCGHNAAGQLGVGDEESRTVFTHVSTLASKNISQIYAGGSHTWALIDYTNPFQENYSPPSPIMDEPGPNYYQAKEIAEQFNEKYVEIILGEVDMYHRFVRVKVPPQNEPHFKLRLNEYMTVLQKDKLNRLIKLQSDNEAQDKNNNEAGYTVMIISEARLEPDEEPDAQTGLQTSIGQQIFIKVQSLRGPKWTWVTLAEKLFAVFQIKYFELRPQQQ